MTAARKDVSGVFDAELRRKSAKKAAVLDKVFHLTQKGMTFVTDTYIPEWTEVGIEMRLPPSASRTGAHKDQAISCRGVVVQCVQREQGRGYEVTLLFFNLNKRDQAQLSVLPPFVSPASISISR
jgi:hypothetical protein